MDCTELSQSFPVKFSYLFLFISCLGIIVTSISDVKQETYFSLPCYYYYLWFSSIYSPISCVFFNWSDITLRNSESGSTAILRDKIIFRRKQTTYVINISHVI
jgi:hypothetical protein